MDLLFLLYPQILYLTGNTVLHMLVIHNKLDMFDLVVDMSSSNGKKPEEAQSLLHIKNHKGSQLTDSCCNSFLSTFPQCSFSLEFPEIRSQNIYAIID